MRSDLLRRARAVAVVLVATAGCTVDAGSDAAPTTGPARASGPALTGAQVLDGLRGSVALVDTPIATGSAVLLADGHLVTNAHVVEPFDVVDVTFEEGAPHRDVPVIGVDLAADLAVLGPIDTDAEPQAIADPADLASASELYLVGFPGNQDDQEVTISDGVLSRRRSVPDWDLEYLQTDATIGAGQSGGALVDDRGRVVGISALIDDDDFALALSGADVAEGVAAILAGDGSPAVVVPTEGDRTAATFHVSGPVDERLVVFPSAERDRDVTITVVGDDPTLRLVDEGFFPLAANEAGHRLFEEAGEDDLEDPVAPDAPGRWTFPIEAGYAPGLLVGSEASGTVELAIEASEPFAVLGGDPTPIDLAVGDDARGFLDYYGGLAAYGIDLEEGEEVDITASSPSGDLAFTVIGPGETFSDASEADDGGGGLLDLDASDRYTATEAGRHQIWLYHHDGAATAYRLEVLEA